MYVADRSNFNISCSRPIPEVHIQTSQATSSQWNQTKDYTTLKPTYSTMPASTDTKYGDIAIISMLKKVFIDILTIIIFLILNLIPPYYIGNITVMPVEHKVHTNV
jgi:hypothetical protein